MTNLLQKFSEDLLIDFEAVSKVLTSDPDAEKGREAWLHLKGIMERLLDALDVAADGLEILEVAQAFGNSVLDGDSYGCESREGGCLHTEAVKFLDEIEEIGKVRRERLRSQVLGRV